MIHIMIRQKVTDYAQWKAVFDAGSETRAAASSKKGHIFRDADDPSIVTLLGHYHDDEKDLAMMQSPELAERMKEAGVTGQPAVFILGAEEKSVD